MSRTQTTEEAEAILAALEAGEARFSEIRQRIKDATGVLPDYGRLYRQLNRMAEEGTLLQRGEGERYGSKVFFSKPVKEKR